LGYLKITNRFSLFHGGQRMIAYKTFAKQLDASKEILAQQNDLRNELVTFINNVATPENVIQINEQALPNKDQFTLTVWYRQPAAEAESEFNRQPEAQSADVLARSLHEHERREVINTMITEHLIRSDSK
jgi:hypothetical protein